MRQQQSRGIMANVTRMSRPRQFFGLLGSVAFVALSPLIVLEGLRSETVTVRRTELPGEVVAAFGAAGALFFGLCAVLYGVALFTRRP